MKRYWFFVFIILAGVIYYAFYKRTKDALNPPGVMVFLFLFFAGICHLDLGAYQKAWSSETYKLILIAAGTISLTGWLLLKKNKAKKTFQTQISNYNINQTQNKNYYKWFYIWVIICTCAAFYGMIENGISFTYVFTNALEGQKGQWETSSITFIEYFSNMLPFCAIMSYFNICFSNLTKRKKKIHIAIIIFAMFYVLFVMCSRGTAMITLLGCVYIAHRKRHFDMMRLTRTFVTILLLFGLYALFRWQDHSSNLAVYSGSSNSLVFNSVYNYIVYCYQNFDTLVRVGSPMTKYMYTLPTIAKMLGTFNENDLMYLSIHGFNACIFITGPYHDFGMFGVILFSAIDTIIVTVLYNYSTQNECYSLPLAMLQRGIMVLFFGDYILLINGQSLPILISILLIIMTKKRANYDS